MTTAETPLSPPKPPRRSRRPGVIAGVVAGALVALFAALNAQSVEVNWLASTTRTPLIVVIVLFLLIGVALGRALGSRPRRGSRGKR